MKKIYLFLLFLPLLSCNDWLDISPENSVTLTNYFQSEADLESLHTSMMACMKSACKGKQPYYYMSVDADELNPTFPVSANWMWRRIPPRPLSAEY